MTKRKIQEVLEDEKGFYRIEGKRKRRLCMHKKRKTFCNECGGVSLCIHGIQKYRCKHKECIKNATSLCKHGRLKSCCKHNDCIANATGICKHGKQKRYCKHNDCIDNATSICIHGRQKYRCKHEDCIAKATSICKHGKLKSNCKHEDCIANATSICIHGKQKRFCPICDPTGHLTNVIRARMNSALGGSKEKHTDEYLGCSYEFFRGWIEAQFHDGMTWQNADRWHVDHIMPVKFEGHDKEGELEKRLHYKNCWPLWAPKNMSKGNRFISVLPLKIIAARQIYLSNNENK